MIRILSKTVLAAAAAALAAAPPAAAQIGVRPYLDPASAKRAAAACLAYAAERNLTVTLAVLDEGGHLLHLERNHPRYATAEYAERKALTALKTGRSSKTFADRVKAGETNLLTIEGFVAIQGGLTIVADGVQIGAIGVSGGSPEQDELCAQAGIDAALAGR